MPRLLILLVIMIVSPAIISAVAIGELSLYPIGLIYPIESQGLPEATFIYGALIGFYPALAVAFFYFCQSRTKMAAFCFALALALVLYISDLNHGESADGVHQKFEEFGWAIRDGMGVLVALAFVFVGGLHPKQYDMVDVIVRTGDGLRHRRACLSGFSADLAVARDRPFSKHSGGPHPCGLCVHRNAGRGGDQSGQDA